MDRESAAKIMAMGGAMHATRFDIFVRSLRSRRRAVLLGTGFGAALLLPRTEVAAGSCLPNGTRCDPAQPGACCTGTCKKHKNHKRKVTFKCGPAGSAQGCTKELDLCRDRGESLCPGNHNGVCINDNKGKPLCIAEGHCRDCATDADCADLGAAARCIKGCKFCTDLGFPNSQCVVPAPPPVAANS